MSAGLQNQISQNTAPQKCPICNSYQRKIEEVEVTLSGREAIISVLHTQLKKFEDNYKKLLCEFEQLRFQHSFALQDNFSLREINSKLEEISFCKCDGSYSEISGSSFATHKSINRNDKVAPILKEVTAIEKLVNAQNDILKDLIDKVVAECSSVNEKFVSATVFDPDTDLRQIGGESGDHLDPKVQLLNAEIDKLRSLVAHYQKENEHMKAIFCNKKNTFAKCTQIETIICSEKDCEALALILDPNMTDQKDTKISQLQKEMREKQKQFETCCCQLMEQLNDMHENNQALTDTLSVVTDENKNNLEIIAKLKNELNKVNEENEKEIRVLKCRINCLEGELESDKLQKKKLSESADNAQQEIDHLKERMRVLIDENNKLKDCKCELDKEFRRRLIELETNEDELRKELGEKALELTEYEEEHTNLCQKLEVLSKYNDELVGRVRYLEGELDKATKVVDKSDVYNQTNKPDLCNRFQMTDVSNNGNGCTPQCAREQIEVLEKLDQMETIKASATANLAEIKRLTAENCQLKCQVDRLKSENKAETGRLQGLVNHSQRQVEMLLKEHDEKTAEIQSVANELDKIRKSVTQDNDHYNSQIKQLEMEKDSLRKQVVQLTCQCEEGQGEVEKLKAEVARKQTIIHELEKSIDSFNETLKNFDQTAEELACENACLRADKERLLKDLQEAETRLRKLQEAQHLMQKMQPVNDVSGICGGRSCTNVVVQNENLRKALEKLKADKEDLQREIEKNRCMQRELESVKRAQCREQAECGNCTCGNFEKLQKAYDELKTMYDKADKENEKLKGWEFLECTKCKAAEGQNKRLQAENEHLKVKTMAMTKEVDALKCECEKLQKDCCAKSLELQTLKVSVDNHKYKQDTNEEQLSGLRAQLEELRNNYELKSSELKKIRKQYESCAKQSQISRDEYNNLRREYKEIKSMLSEQTKKFKQDPTSAEVNQLSKALQLKLAQKQKEIAALQEKLKDASYEIIDLKDQVNKVISDNNTLKSAINNLIGNLERKIKGPISPENSAEIIAGEILNSLNSIENIIVHNGEACPKGCGKICDCMSEILSQYTYKDFEPSLSACSGNPEKLSRSSNCGCKKSSKTISETMFDTKKPEKSEPSHHRTSSYPHKVSKKNSKQFPKCASEPVNRLCPGNLSEHNSTDSDDTQSSKFLDQRSLNYFKEAIQEMKRSRSPLTDNSCRCHSNIVHKSCNC